MPRMEQKLRDNFGLIGRKGFARFTTPPAGVNPYDGIGETFYVDPINGDNTYDGETPGRAKANLQNAIDLCVALRGDLIVRMPGSEKPTSAITVNKAGVTIAASGYGEHWNADDFFTFPAASYTTGPVIYVDQPCRIVGLGFETRFTTGPAMKIRYDTGMVGYGVHILNCKFEKWWSGIGLELFGASACTIEGCRFNNFTTGGIQMSGSGVHNPNFVDIIDNRFMGCTQGVNITTTVMNTNFFGNHFMGSTIPIDFNGNGVTGVCTIQGGSTQVAGGDDFTDYANVAAAKAADIFMCGIDFPT